MSAKSAIDVGDESKVDVFQGDDAAADRMRCEAT
jgi:hypothetical protein